MQFGSYVFIQRWLMSLLCPAINCMWQARLVTSIIALAMYDYLSSPHGIEGQRAFAFFNSQIFSDYCGILGINEQYIIDTMNKLEYDEKENIIYNKHSGGLWQA